MEPSDVQHAVDRRDRAALTFDPASGRLALGGFVEVVPTGSSNRIVLNSYVELMARCRGDRIANLVEVRQADVEALAEALDLDAADLDAEIQRVLGASRAEALDLASRMRGARLIGGLASAVARTVAPSAPAADTSVAEATFLGDDGEIWPDRPLVE